jgi:hypothetical protein
MPKGHCLAAATWLKPKAMIISPMEATGYTFWELFAKNRQDMPTPKNIS